MPPCLRVRRLVLALAMLTLVAAGGAATIAVAEKAASDATATGDTTSAPAAVPTAATSPGTRTLYLVRHGLYDEADTLDEAVGQGLTEAGRTQAQLTGARLAALGVPFDTLWTSPLTRARETAAIIAQSLPGLTPRIAPELAECTPTTWRKDVTATLKAGEAEACRAQLETVFARFFVPSSAGDRHELLVCHGNVIRWLWCRALGVEPGAWLGMAIANCSLTVIQVKPDGACKLYVFGDAAHLPAELQTYPGGALAPWRPSSR
jgi:serine/threonine-protein phosphatase PGAM5